MRSKHIDAGSICRLVKLQALFRGILVRKHVHSGVCKMQECSLAINEEIAKKSQAFSEIREYLIRTNECECSVFRFQRILYELNRIIQIREIFRADLIDSAVAIEDAPLHGYTEEMQREILYLEDAIRKRIQVIQHT